MGSRVVLEEIFAKLTVAEMRDFLRFKRISVADDSAVKMVLLYGNYILTAFQRNGESGYSWTAFSGDEMRQWLRETGDAVVG